MAKIVRVGVTFPPVLLKEFDEIAGKMGYKSRSKAIQDAVHLFVSEKKWLKEDHVYPRYIQGYLLQDTGRRYQCC